MSLKASVILLICVPLIPISIVVVQKIAKKLLNKYWSIYTGLGDSFLENLQGLTTLKIYQADQQKADEMDVESQNFRKITMKVLTMQLNSTSVMDIVAYGGAAIGMAVAVSEFLKGNISVAGTLCIVLLASEFFLPLRLLGSFFHIAMNGMAASDKIFKILDLPEPQAGEKTLPDGALDVTLKDVYFSYEPNQKLIEHFNLQVKPGQRVAIVGPTGCGKTTLINLLMRFYDVNSGAIKVSEKDIRKVTRESLRANYGMVLQETWLKQGTIRENIVMGRENATDDEVLAAAKASHAHSFIKRLPNGYDTVIGEDGGSLSAGQKQLLCITRVMLCLPPMLILDEATSSIDTRTEMRIQKAFATMMQGRTSFLVAHRLSTIQEADVILVMRDGKIVEQGNHEELLAANGFYKNLFDAQWS